MSRPFLQLLALSIVLLLWIGVSLVSLVDQTKGEDDELRPLEIKDTVGCRVV